MSSSQLQTLTTNFNSLLNDYQTTYNDFIANIDSNVEKIAGFMATIGIKGIQAQMEFSEKSIR